MAMAAAHGAVGVGEIQTKGVGNGFQNGIAAECGAEDRGDVNTASNDVGRDERLDLFSAKIAHDMIAL